MLNSLENLVTTFGGCSSQRVWGPYDLFDHLKIGFPGIQDIDSVVGRQSLVYSMHGWRIGSLGFVAGEHSALMAKGGYDSSGMSINFLFSGSQTYKQVDLIQARPMEGAVLLNHEPAWVKTTHTHSMGVFFDPERAVKISGVMFSGSQIYLNLQPRYIVFGPAQARFVRRLPNLLAALKLHPRDAEDTVYRFLARLLICGDQHFSKSLLRQEAKQVAIDHACAFMRERISDDITLTEIEEASGLSARSLQLGFKQRFGCGPKFWLTQLRLELAYGALQRDSSARPISEIAEHFGFHHMGRFSALFRARFGIPPSHVRALR